MNARKPLRLQTPREVKVIEVIRVESVRGAGEEADPIRPVYQYYSLDGNLLAEWDTIERSPDTTGESL